MRLSLGAVSNREQEMSQALAAPMAEAERFIRDQDKVNMDETSFAEGKVDGRGLRAWLWLVANALVAVFRIATSRGSEVAKGLLGEDFVLAFTRKRGNLDREARGVPGVRHPGPR